MTLEKFDSSLYKPIIITIDGTAASGKGTVVNGLQENLDERYEILDAGLMYRALTFYYIQKGILPEKLKNFENLEDKLLRDVNISFTDLGIVVLNGKEIEENSLRSTMIGAQVANYSELDEVKRYIVRSQKELIENSNCGWILDGRCMGSAVVPQAQVKFFTDAELWVRASRRHQDFEKQGITGMSTEDVYKLLNKRDKKDRNTKIAPLVKPENAYELDVCKLAKEDVINKTLNYVRKKIIEEGKL